MNSYKAIMNKNNFKFWVPLELSKAKDENGVEVMKLGGIASTIEQDSDGETLDPTGFDLSILKSTGVINWHHQQKNAPLAIIGEPTKAEITKKGLYLEAELYKDSDLAKQVYKLAEILKANSKTRRLGFSIEGKATQRDPLDSKKILKANITGCAITYMPKNPATFADIIKGGGNSDFEFELEEPDDANGGKVKYLVNMVTKDGNTIKVTENGEISMDFSKSLSTDSPSGKALKKEHVDSGLKEIVKSVDDSKELTKAEVYDKIFSDFSDIDLSKAKQIYNIITKISQMSNKIKPTQEEISKAYETLGITDVASNEEETIQKGETTEEEEEEENKKEKVEKAYASNIKKDDEEEEEEEEEEETEEKPTIKKSETDESPLYFQKGDHFVQMSNVGGELKEIEGRKFAKNGDSFKEIIEDPIQKAFQETLNKIQESNDEIKKAMGTVISDLSTQVSQLKSEISELASQPAGGRKSATTAKVAERNFSKGGDSENLSENKNGTLISINNRPAVLNILEKAMVSPLEKGGKELDLGFEKALTVFEASGQLPLDIQKRLTKEFGVVIGE